MAPFCRSPAKFATCGARPDGFTSLIRLDGRRFAAGQLFFASLDVGHQGCPFGDELLSPTADFG
jgi:hypothetical protein